MSFSARIYKKNISNKKVNDSSSGSNTSKHKENNSTKQLQSYQSLADQYVTNQSDQNNFQLQSKENKTGIPDNIKNGVESLSGQSLDEVRVHYNSSKPAQLKAHAYAEGNQIHIASGQEKHVAHEAWHVIQQKENRVSSTREINGHKINDDPSLEKEADVMGAKASSLNEKPKTQLKKSNSFSSLTKQGVIQRDENSQDDQEQEEQNEAGSLKTGEKAQKAATELNSLKSDGDDVYKSVQTLEDPSVEPESITQTLMNKVKGVTTGISTGIFKTIKSLASPIVQIIGGVSTGYQKWAAWTNLKELGTKQAESGGETDEKIPYTIEKLAKGFLVAVNSIVQGIIDLVGNILSLIPEALSQAANAGLKVYKAIYTGIGKLYSVPKRWYQMWKGKSNKKDVNSEKVCNDAWNGDDNAIDFIWALNLPSIQGSGFEALDNLKNFFEKAGNAVANAAIDSVNSVAGTKIDKSSEPQNIASMIKSGSGEGKIAFKNLIINDNLNPSSKNKIQGEVRDAMTGFGT